MILQDIQNDFYHTPKYILQCLEQNNVNLLHRLFVLYPKFIKSCCHMIHIPKRHLQYITFSTPMLELFLKHECFPWFLTLQSPILVHYLFTNQEYQHKTYLKMKMVRQGWLRNNCTIPVYAQDIIMMALIYSNVYSWDSIIRKFPWDVYFPWTPWLEFFVKEHGSLEITHEIQKELCTKTSCVQNTIIPSHKIHGHVPTPEWFLLQSYMRSLNKIQHLRGLAIRIHPHALNEHLIDEMRTILNCECREYCKSLPMCLRLNRVPHPILFDVYRNICTEEEWIEKRQKIYPNKKHMNIQQVCEHLLLGYPWNHDDLEYFFQHIQMNLLSKEENHTIMVHHDLTEFIQDIQHRNPLIAQTLQNIIIIHKEQEPETETDDEDYEDATDEENSWSDWFKSWFV